MFIQRTLNNDKARGRSHDSPLPPSSIDGSPVSVPAAGWRDGTSLNNTGSNGNYWSSTPNESDSQNAYNLNFNSGNCNTNWNNRNNGRPARPVAELTSSSPCEPAGSPRFSITKERLLADLVVAYRAARRKKRGKAYQLKFEYNAEDNLVSLRDDLLGGTYKPQPCTCFIIHDPKMREVFAADFRDRIVHHLFYNYTHALRADVHSGQLQLHRGPRDALRHREAYAPHTERVGGMVAAVLCLEDRHPRLLHVDKP